MKTQTLVIQRTLDATPEEVFAAWTSPERVAEWYGPEGFTNIIHQMEVQPGGVYRLTMKAPDGKEHTLRGEYQRMEPPNTIVMTWQWENPEEMEGMEEETVVTVELEGRGGKTLMTVTHSGFFAAAPKINHIKGWMSSFNKLEKLVHA